MTYITPRLKADQNHVLNGDFTQGGLTWHRLISSPHPSPHCSQALLFLDKTLGISPCYLPKQELLPWSFFQTVLKFFRPLLKVPNLEKPLLNRPIPQLPTLLPVNSLTFSFRVCYHLSTHGTALIHRVVIFSVTVSPVSGTFSSGQYQMFGE